MLDDETAAASSTLPESTPASMWCKAKRKDGGKCHGWPDGSGYCPCHRPDALANQAAGGRASSKQQRLEHKLPSRLKPVVELLSKALVECHKGQLQPSRAQAMAAVASALVKVLEHGEFELRLTRLEELYSNKEASTWELPRN